jgi:hypothetical protein
VLERGFSPTPSSASDLHPTKVSAVKATNAKMFFSHISFRFLVKIERCKVKGAVKYLPNLLRLI